MCVCVCVLQVLEQQIAELEAMTSAPGFWDDPAAASATTQELSERKAVQARASEVAALSQDMLTLWICVCMYM